ncbi:MAG TPA: gamma-glutamylcyclotransferase family protein, partial [Solirubrobacterales bacterium]
MSAWVFAYGSLVLPASVAETLGERPGRTAVAAELAGWRRGFTQARDNRACEKTFALADGSVPERILGLNVDPADGHAVNGVALAVTKAELARLDARELRYDRVAVDTVVAAAEPLAGPAFT